MLNSQTDQKNIPLRIIKNTGTIVLGVVGTWIAISRFAINHEQPLPDAVAASRKHFIAPGAGRLSYYVDTSASGRPLVLLHSINAAPSAYEVKPLFEHYRGVRPVYALELPGFGFSERNRLQYSPQLFADAILAFINQEIGEPVDILALSLSCEFVARAAQRQPENFHSLIFVSPTGLRETQPEVPTDQLYSFFSFPLWSQAIFDLLVIKPSIRFFLGKSFVGDAPDDFVDYAYLTAHQPGARYAPLYFVSGALFTNDIFESVYVKLETPTLVIYDRDPNVTFERLPELVNANPMWRAVQITPTMGLPHWEAFDQTISVLEAFWSEM